MGGTIIAQPTSSFIKMPNASGGTYWKRGITHAEARKRGGIWNTVAPPQLGVRKFLRFFLAEVGGDDFRVGADFGGSAFGDFYAVIQHRDSIRNAHHDVHVMLDQ